MGTQYGTVQRAFGQNLRGLQDLSMALTGMRKSEAALLIKADASASHQAVVNVLEAARMNGVSKIAFATQNSAQANKP